MDPDHTDSEMSQNGESPCNLQELQAPKTLSSVFGPRLWQAASTDPSLMGESESLIRWKIEYYYKPLPLPDDTRGCRNCSQTGIHKLRYDNMEDLYLRLTWNIGNPLRDEILLLQIEHNKLGREYVALLNQHTGSSIAISVEPYEMITPSEDWDWENWNGCVCCNCYRLMEENFMNTVLEIKSLIVDLDFLRIEHQHLTEKFLWLKENIPTHTRHVQFGDMDNEKE